MSGSGQAASKARLGGLAVDVDDVEAGAGDDADVPVVLVLRVGDELRVWVVEAKRVGGVRRRWARPLLPNAAALFFVQAAIPIWWWSPTSADTAWSGDVALMNSIASLALVATAELVGHFHRRQAPGHRPPAPAPDFDAVAEPWL